MKTITIRDLRQRWPEAEAALEIEEEIVITRDSKPVAKLVRIPPAKPTKKRWDPVKFRKRINAILGKKTRTNSLKLLEELREDRKLI